MLDVFRGTLTFLLASIVLFIAFAANAKLGWALFFGCLSIVFALLSLSAPTIPKPKEK